MIIFLALFISISLMAQQSFEISWQSNYGGSNNESANAVIKTLDNAFFVLGSSSSVDGHVVGNHGLSDYWGLLIDENNNFAQIPFGGSQYDYGADIKQTLDGGYILVGQSGSNDEQVSGNHGGTDVWVIKLSPIGHIEWQKCLGGSEADAGFSVLIASDGGYLLGCSTYSNDGDVSINKGWSDIWLVKLSESGSIEWEKTYGGSDFDICSTVIMASDNSYIIAGSTYSNDGDVTGNHGSYDHWIVKVDQMGNIEWQKCLGGSDYDQSADIIQASDGYYYVLGYAQSTDGDVIDAIGHTDFWLVKLDEAGTIIWTHSYGGTDYDDGYSLCEFEGDIIMTGKSNSVNGDVSLHIGAYDIWTIGVNTNGNIQWEKSLGGQLDDNAMSIINADPGLMIAGSSYSSDGDLTGNMGDMDFWVLKLEKADAVNENGALMTRIYPNPVMNGILYVQSSEASYFELISGAGNVVLSEHLKNGNQSINVNNLSAGLYFARFISSKGIQIEKVLIE